MLADEFRVNHRAASESLLRAVATEVSAAHIHDALDQAVYFETEAMLHIHTPRERALGMGLLHAVDLIRAVTDAEFHRIEG
jgi:hypothetical protein